MNDEHNYQHQMEKLEATNAALLEALVSLEKELRFWENTNDPISKEERQLLAGIASRAIRKAKEEQT